MWRLVPALVARWARLSRTRPRQALITDTLKTEETRFRATLARGLAILDEETAGLEKGAVFPGDVAFKLYDTYGFPLDLTEDALRPRGIASIRMPSMRRDEAPARRGAAAWSGSARRRLMRSGSISEIKSEPLNF